MSTRPAPDRYFDTDGARLRWRLEGAGSALVLLHGWALDLAYWDPLVAQLARRFTVLRFDRRGFGLSEGLPDIHRNVADLAALLAAAGLQRAVLVGMSQGARLALHFTLRHPEHVRGLVLDGAPAVDAEPELPLKQLRRVLETQGIEALRKEILAHPLMQLRESSPDRHAMLAGMLTRYEGLDLQHPVPRASPPDLPSIRVPTLVITGAHDGAARRTAGRDLRAAIDNAQQVELAGAGHLALLDDPEGYAAALQAFCHQLPP